MTYFWHSNHSTCTLYRYIDLFFTFRLSVWPNHHWGIKVHHPETTSEYQQTRHVCYCLYRQLFLPLGTHHKGRFLGIFLLRESQLRSSDHRPDRVVGGVCDNVSNPDGTPSHQWRLVRYFNRYHRIQASVPILDTTGDMYGHPRAFLCSLSFIGWM